LFAIGVAVGLARAKNHGAAGTLARRGRLSGGDQGERRVLIAVPVAGGWPIVSGPCARELGPSAAYKAHEAGQASVWPVGILSGLTAGAPLQTAFYNIKTLPSYLAFFGGAAFFVPIASGFRGPWCWRGRVRYASGSTWSRAMERAQPLGAARRRAGALFAYGGAQPRADRDRSASHHQQHCLVPARGLPHGVTGDLKRFFAGDPSAGAFMSGFFFR